MNPKPLGRYGSWEWSTQMNWSVTLNLCIFQLQKLLESLEIHMIQEVLRKVNREMTLFLSEKSKEESTLPTGNACLFYSLESKHCFSECKLSVLVGQVLSHATSTGLKGSLIFQGLVLS